MQRLGRCVSGLKGTKDAPGNSADEVGVNTLEFSILSKHPRQKVDGSTHAPGKITRDRLFHLLELGWTEAEGWRTDGLSCSWLGGAHATSAA